MITMEDCIAFSGLTEEEILAVAEHEHISGSAAVTLAQYLSRQDGGFDKVGVMIVDDIKAAQSQKKMGHVQELLHVLHHFLKAHPEAAPSQHPWSGR